MGDYSGMSNEDLTDSIAWYRKQLGGEIRLDEGSDEEKYFRLKNELKEMEAEARRKKISDSQIWSARFRGEERERSIIRDIRFVERVSNIIVNNPSDLFDSEIATLQKDSMKRGIIYDLAKEKSREKIRDYELSKRRGEIGTIKLFGYEINPRNEWMMVPWVTNEFQLIDEKTQYELDNCAIRISRIIHELGIKNSGEYQEIRRNLFWVDGVNFVMKYLKGVEFLAEKKKKGEKHYVEIPELLDFKNVEIIAKSFISPVFLHWFYEGRLPSYSWSATSGEEMMKALTTGDYKKGYDAERRLIKRVNRDISERYG